MSNQKIVTYALNFLLSNIDETTEEDLGMTAEQIEIAIEIESNKMKKTKHIATGHKLVKSEKQFEAATILFACMVGAGLIVLIALAMG
tara:strand:- start:195 stop:458 length:264 start_codon:yes stop_codon:yes gene_type:complete